MWELICHHTYKWHGLATDLSLYESHGSVKGASFLADGAAPGSGALRFGSSDHIHMEPGRAWNRLVGLRVECTARINTVTPHRQTFIEADSSFGVQTADRRLFAWFRAQPSTHPGATTEVLATYHAGVGLPPYRLPLNKWFQILFVHDGLTHMQFSVDGAAVTPPRAVLSGIPGVKPKGIRIGNGLAGNEAFEGDIDDIKIWRLDPNEARRQFVGRPMDPATADCWTRFVESLRDAFAKYPDCAEKLRTQMIAAVDRLRRAIVTEGPETRQRFEEAGAHYANLWREGRIDGPEMRKLVIDWCTWLRLVGIPLDDPAFRDVMESQCWKLIRAEIASIDCDPRAIAFLRLLAEGCGHPLEHPHKNSGNARRRQSAE